jgi:hypothetical protein
MRRMHFFIVICLLSATVSHSQKWDDLSDEQKLTKLKSFRADNQKYLKDSLKLTQTQLTDLDNLNACFLSTLDRIDRYAKENKTKEEYAEALWDVRWAQVDAIMGKDKHEKYAAFIKRKIAQAMEKKQI